MKLDKASIEDQISRLPNRNCALGRARLALKLIESLEPGQDEDVDEPWLDEVERRLAEYDSGPCEARDMEEAIAGIERRLK